MKYKELINFESITSIIKLDDAGEQDIAKDLVKTFVFSDKIKEDIIPIIVNNLNLSSKTESKGIQIVGSYGTGKSHLMALISIIAENADFLELLKDRTMIDKFKPFAGQYKVIRFEIGSTIKLYERVYYQINQFLEQNNIDFQFNPDSKESYKKQIREMMTAFQEKFFDKGLLIVIDEMLEFLKGRDNRQLNEDLMFLRQLGEACDRSRFKIIFGVQELLYEVNEFYHQQQMLQHLEDRFDDLLITKEDVAFVVKQRLLLKDEAQKVKIRTYLSKFSHLFSDLQNRFSEYVELFPVHPEYISNFEKIKQRKKHREILKTLSFRFEEIAEQEVPEEFPGLITVDSYWNNIAANPALKTDPDIRTTDNMVKVVYDKIDSYFTGARRSNIPIAKKIVNNLAIKLLHNDLQFLNGATIETLKDELCITMPGVDSQELLIDNLERIAKAIITSTSGEFFDKNKDNHQFYIRVQGGVNFDQLIKDKADNISKSKEELDSAFYIFLEKNLPLDYNPYRTGFKIWSHSIEWSDKKMYRDGYIFFGNPNERSTTQPIQHFYFYFLPLFSEIKPNTESDEVYFNMTGLSKEFKDFIGLYGAAHSLLTSASSDQKGIYRQKIDEIEKKLRDIFDKEFIAKSKVIYKNQSFLVNSFPLPPAGSERLKIFNSITEKLLNLHFNEKNPNHPAFTTIKESVTPNNLDGTIKATILKILTPQIQNKNGEAILEGLKLWIPGSLDISNSIYAQNILKTFREKGNNKVINRDEILYCHWQPTNIWYSKDFTIDYRFEFIVLATLIAKGEIEITWSGLTINATNIDKLRTLKDEDYYTFVSIKRPKDIPIDAVKALLNGLGLGEGLFAYLEKDETFIAIHEKVKSLIEKLITAKNICEKGIKCNNINLIDEVVILEYNLKFKTLHTTLDKILSYNSYAKIKNFEFSPDFLKDTFEAFKLIEKVETSDKIARKFENLIGYLQSARQYSTDESLANEITNAINEFPSKITLPNKELIKYETILKDLKDRFADFYLKEYFKHRLSEREEMKRQTILNSSKKKICDTLKEASFISKHEYEEWLKNILNLKPAKKITKADVIQYPFHDFNPKDYKNKIEIEISEFENKLTEIYDNYIQQMYNIFDDPGVKENLDLLDDHAKNTLEKFGNKQIDITTANAQIIRDLLETIFKGLDKVELKTEGLRDIFKKPLNPKEAIEKFKEYIDELTKGKDKNKVRIIFK